MTKEKIIKLAKTLATVHGENIKSDLPCQYKTIDINLDCFLEKIKNIDNNLYTIILNNNYILKDIINECNQNIQYINNNLCISHNDYKLGNILWDNNNMYLIDFDACCMSNPAVSLAEASYALSIQNNILNKDFYKIFLESYLKVYKITDYENALKVALNGKLQWLEYLINKCNKEDKQTILDIKSMIKELIMYKENQKEFLKIYENINIDSFS